MKYSKIAVSCAALFLVLFMLVGCFSGCRRKKKKMTSETTDYSQTASEQNSNQKITVKDNFGYVDKGGYAELVYYAGDMEATKIDIPSTIDGLPVRELREYIFADCNKTTDINIPDGITYIGKYAFVSCEMLRSVSIPDGITELNEGLFKYCSSLENVVLPESLKTIGDYVFAGCSSLEKINIPQSVEVIEDHAFSGCINLKDSNIPIDISEEVTYGVTGTFPECRDWTRDILLSDDDNDGIYTTVITGLNKGIYEFKVRANGEWTDSWGDLENGITYNSQLNCSIELTGKSDIEISFDTTGSDRNIWTVYRKVLDND